MVLEDLRGIHALDSGKNLGIPRWDYILDNFKYSGSIVIPITVDNQTFKPPFYYLFEVLNGRFMFYIKYLNGDPYRIGDVYGFYGLSFFKDYTPGLPIILTEGYADLAALQTIYPYVLCVMTGHLSSYQKFILSTLTDKLILALDQDKTGLSSMSKLLKDKSFTSTFSVRQVIPPLKDFGKCLESGYGLSLLSRTKSNILTYLLKWGISYDKLHVANS